MSEWGLPFPWEELAEDPLERFLIAEAIMTRYQEEKDAAIRRAESQSDAMAKARAMLGRK